MGGTLSPRAFLKGGKIKPLTEGEEEMHREGSTLSDTMLTAPSALGHQSPAIMSPFKNVVPGSTGGGGLEGGMGGLLPPPPPTLGGIDAGLAGGMPHSSSMGGGMDALMLPGMGLGRGDSMANLALMGGLSRNTSGMLGG